jgi:glycosyltransferase involved in cell wall biosynthesis
LRYTPAANNKLDSDIQTYGYTSRRAAIAIIGRAKSGNTMRQALVTVYMPTYNRLALLQRAVNSVLSQSYENIELIVVDDGSTDGTIEYMQGLAAANGRVVFLRNDGNQGACVSRNKAISLAKGEFVTGLDDDDYFLPERIASFIEFWPHRSKGVVALYSKRQEKASEGQFNNLRAPNRIDWRELLLRNPIGNQLFVETALIRKAGAFDARFPAWQDLDFCLVLLRQGDAQCVDNRSYVVDTSHPHERISTRKIENIVLAYERIVEKHKLTDLEAKRLRIQLLEYRYSYPEALALLGSFIAHGDIAATVKSLKRLAYHFLKAS